MLATTSRFRLPAFISAVLAILMMLGSVPATAADTATASIQGTVTAPAGVNLAGIPVYAMSTAAQSQVQQSANVAPDGSYKITGLPAGSYKIGFTGWNTGAQEQWYQNAASFDKATAVTVTAGQDLTGINATLVKGATISGKVTAPAGVNLIQPSLSVPRRRPRRASRPSPPASARTAATRSPACRQDPTSSSSPAGTRRPGQWYGNAASFDTATAVTVTAGQDLTGINATLVKGATISGKVTAPAGVDVARVSVSAWSASVQTRWASPPVWHRTAATRSSACRRGPIASSSPAGHPVPWSSGT